MSSRASWEQHAGFLLFFDYLLDQAGKPSWQVRIWQTRVYHHETGEEHLFSGTAPSQWVNWIFEHADLPSEVRADLIEPPTTKIIFRDLQVNLATTSAAPEKMITAELRFALVGVGAEALTATQIAYQILLHIVDLESGLIQLVATTSSQFLPGQFEYIHRLKFPIPNVGRYEVLTLFLTAAPIELLARHQGPSFRVTP